MARKDRARPDPFRIQDAERFIATIHAEWGESQGNYDEFRFFTGLRPSEQIALTVSDFDSARGTLSVTKARVDGFDKNTTKTGEDRIFELRPRAVAVLKRQLNLRERLHRTQRIDSRYRSTWTAMARNACKTADSSSQALLRPP